MFADFDLRDLKPFLVVGFVLVVVIAQALAKGKKLLQDSWNEESWQPRSPGEVGDTEPAPIIRRHERPPPLAPPLSLPPVSQRPPRPRPAGAWEAELERILRGDTAPAPVQAPAPVAPPPPSRSRSATFDYQEDSDLESAPAARPVRTPLGEAAPAPSFTLHEQIVQRMRQVDARVGQHSGPTAAAFVAHPAATAESVAVRQWLRQPETARAAMVAATVFGPPKAFES
jgi:hypothetical protein